MTTLTQAEYQNIYGSIYAPSAYEAASTDYKVGSKGLIVGSADEHVARELIYLQLRSYHAIRNNAHAATGLKKWNQALGSIGVNWKVAEGKNKGKGHALMQSLWDEFYANPSIDNIGDGNNIQEIWKNSIFVAGASHTRLRIKRTKNKNKVPLKLELIAPELHDVMYSNYSEANNIRYGIQFSGTVPSAYFYKQDAYKYALRSTTIRTPQVIIPADEIIHAYKRIYAGQLLGIPELAPVLLALYDLDELADATLAKQKAAQAIGIIIENSNPTAQVAIGSPVSAYSYAEQKTKVKFDTTGGNTLYLGPGERASFFEATDIGPNLQVLIDRQLSKIASCLDLPYHEFTGDVSKLNFAIIKALAQSLRLSMIHYHNLVTIPMNLVPLCTKFQELSQLYNRSTANAIPTFQLPRYFGTDDLKDAQADILEIKYGLNTYARSLSERGLTPEEVEQDRKFLEELGLEHYLKVVGQDKSMNQPQDMESAINTKGS